MTTKLQRQRLEKIEAIVAWGKARGWEQDRWGNLKITTRPRQLRIKFQKQNVRLEEKMSSGEWFRLSSKLYKSLQVDSCGLLCGLNLYINDVRPAQKQPPTPRSAPAQFVVAVFELDTESAPQLHALFGPGSEKACDEFVARRQDAHAADPAPAKSSFQYIINEIEPLS